MYFYLKSNKVQTKFPKSTLSAKTDLKKMYMQSITTKEKIIKTVRKILWDECECRLKQDRYKKK